MQIIIVYDKEKNETLDQANSFLEFVEVNLCLDAWEYGIDNVNFETDVIDADAFDLICPEYYN